jgi:Na+-driven multidrug efflux pump
VAWTAVLWPLLAEIVLGYALGLAGLWLASRQGDVSAASFALSQQVVGAAALLFRIINVGVSVVITQACGAQNTALAQGIARASLGANTWLGLATGAVICAFSGVLLTALGADTAVQTAGTTLLLCLGLALVADAHCAAMGSVLRANLRGRDAMWASGFMHASHLLMSLWLMPQMGLAGFGVAMLASRLLTVALHVHLWRRGLGLSPVAADWFRMKPELLKGALRIGLPGAAENVAYRVATLLCVMVVTGMGTQALAAHSYVQQIVTVVVLITVAMGFAGEIVVGHLIGAGDLHGARRLVRRVLVAALAISFALALLNVWLAPWSLRQFTSSSAVLELALPVVWVAVVLEPGRACNVVIINALRAAGDAQFPVWVGAVSMLVVMAGGAWLLGAWWGLGLVGVWIALAADELLRGGLMLWRWESLAWRGKARRLRLLARQQMA